MIAALWQPRTRLGEAFLSGLDLTDDRATRARCERLSRALEPLLVVPGANGSPYLTRWMLEDDGFKRRVFLHRFSQSDRPTLRHSHPWRRAESVILAGSYIDDRAGRAVVTLKPGDHNVLTQHDYHRVTLLAPEVWTLFIVGQVVQSWDFIEIATGRRIPHRELTGGRA